MTKGEMKVIKGLRQVKTPVGGSVVTIGVFDGVHIGHRRIIEMVVKRAKRLGIKSVVLTFDPHPIDILRPKSRIPSLISLGHRIRLIESLGADILIVVKFSKTFAKLSAGKFAKDILVSRLGAREVYVSEGFYFGKGAGADKEKLKDMGRALGFKVNIVAPVKADGHTVSSSLIRRAIAKGDLALGAKLLGRPVSILGTVVRGARLARELGYPTANVNPHHEVIPPSGVYAVRVSYRGISFKGVLNIGTRPTFFGPRDREPSIEAHIFDFHKHIYGEDLEILFIKKLREEVKFKDRADLVRRIRKDAKQARAA